MSEEDLPRFIRPGAFAKRIGVSETVVRRWISAGIIPAVQVGKWKAVLIDWRKAELVLAKEHAARIVKTQPWYETSKA